MKQAEFFQILNLEPSADLVEVEARFYNTLKERIQRACDNPDYEHLAGEEKWLHDVHQSFFDYAQRWMLEKAYDFDEEIDEDYAAKLKDKGKKALKTLHNCLIDFALCYMRIKHGITLLNHEAEKQEKLTGTTIQPNSKWGADVDISVEKHIKHKQKILEACQKTQDMAPVTKTLENLLSETETIIEKLIGKEKATPLIRTINTSLRVFDLPRMQKTIDKIKQEKVRFTINQKTAKTLHEDLQIQADKIKKLTTDNQDILKGAENKLILKTSEAEALMNAQKQALTKVSNLLNKYHMSYLQKQLENLPRLQRKLTIIGTLDSMLSLYVHLVTGLVTPMNNMKDIRIFESEVINRIDYLLHTQNQEVNNLMKLAAADLRAFYQRCTILHDLRNAKA